MKYLISNESLNKANEYENSNINELENYKKQIKEEIRGLIEEGLVGKAKFIIDEYEKIVKDDIEIYSMKSVICVMGGDINGALLLVNKGLSINPDYIDLLYNKAYLLEEKKYYKESYKLYKNILGKIYNEELKYKIQNKLKEIKNLSPYADLDGELSILHINRDVDLHIYDYIVKWLHEFGFTILQADIKLVKNDNIKYVMLYDLNPVNMNGKNKVEFPDINNERYFLIESLKEELFLKFGIENNNNLYLTKNENEVKDIIEELLEGEKEELYKEINKIELSYKTDYHVFKLFDGFRHRAKTELINYRDGLAVKKTWKPGNEKFFQREKFAYGELSKTISYIPTLLESGENYIIIPYYDDLLHSDETMKKIMLTNNIVEIATFLKELYQSGYFNPDIHPGQFVFSESDGLKAIDFEYLQPYYEKPNTFIESYDIKGYPKNFKGDKPNYVGSDLHQWYDKLWVKYTGYNLEKIANLVLKGKYNNNDLQINKVLGLLNYAKTSGKSYNGSWYGSAYHSLRLKEYYFRGQRECDLRLQKLHYDFSDKTVLDIGCNAGGMLHAISDKVKIGIGIDYDYKLINASNGIRTINGTNNLSFYRFDLENEDLNLIKNFILSEDEKVDICFLLSICMWIKNWKEVIAFVASISNNLLFETNGTQKQQLDQIEELKKHYENIEIIEEESNDDPGQGNRILLFCRKELKEKIIVNSNIPEYDKENYKSRIGSCL